MSLVEQLRDGGRMVIPVSGVMLLVVRTGTAGSTPGGSPSYAVTEHGHYRFVPLR